MNYQSLIVVAVIVCLGLSGGLWFAQKNDVNASEISQIVDAAVTRLGSVTSPDISSLWLKWGGIRLDNRRQAMQTATTTLCAIPNPRNATTTFDAVVAQINVGTSTAAAITIATSTSQYATSTSNELIADYSVASGARATITYVPSSGQNILGPNELILVRTAGAGLGGYTYGGLCQVDGIQSIE